MPQKNPSIDANLTRFHTEADYGYQNSKSHLKRREEITRLVLKAADPRKILMDPGSHILNICDMGIGNGFLVNQYGNSLSEKPFPVVITGVDLSSANIAKLKKEGSIQKGFVKSIENSSLPADSQDIVILSEVLEHTRTPMISLREIYRILRSEGTFIGSVPNLAQFWDRVAMLRGEAPHQVRRKVDDPSFTHESHFTIKSLRRALKEAGFIEIIITTNFVRLLRGSKEREVPLASNLFKAYIPGLGDRLIWSARKPAESKGVKTKIPSLYLITGSPRTGKSTLSKELAERTGAKIISISGIRFEQTKSSPKFIPEELVNAYNASVDLVADQITAGKSIIWEGTFRSPESREKIRELIQKVPSGYRIIPVQLYAPAAIIKKRVRKTQEYHVDKDVTEDRAQELVRTYPSFPGAFMFSTARHSPAKIAQSILDIEKKGII